MKRETGEECSSGPAIDVFAKILVAQHAHDNVFCASQTVEAESGKSHESLQKRMYHERGSRERRGEEERKLRDTIANRGLLIDGSER